MSEVRITVSADGLTQERVDEVKRLMRANPEMTVTEFVELLEESDHDFTD